MLTGTVTVPPGPTCKPVGMLRAGSGPDGLLLGRPGQVGSCATVPPEMYRFRAVASAAVTRPSPVMSPTTTGSSTG